MWTKTGALLLEAVPEKAGVASFDGDFGPFNVTLDAAI
jgi:hypothetical protein